MDRDDIDFIKLKDHAATVKQISQVDGTVFGPGAHVIEEWLNYWPPDPPASIIHYESRLERDLDKNVTVTIILKLGDREAKDVRSLDKKFQEAIMSLTE